MKRLEFNELLGYYNGFNLDTGESLVWHNCTLEQSKTLAYIEIVDRASKYRNEHETEHKAEALIQLYDKFKSILRLPSDIFIVDTVFTYKASDFCFAVSKQSTMLYNQKIPEINAQIIEKMAELELIWSNDPDNLRYQSKFWGSTVPNQYFKENFVIHNWISTEKQDFRINFSSCLNGENVNLTARNASKYDVIIYPVFNSYDGFYHLKAFIFHLLAANRKNLKLIICWVYDKSDDLELNERNRIEGEKKIREIMNHKFLMINSCHVIIDSTETGYSYRTLIDAI